MDIRWLVLVFLNEFIFVHCSDCTTEKLKYLAKIEIKWDEGSELVQRGLGSLIHPYYVITAGSFVIEYHEFHGDDHKYPDMTVQFPNNDQVSFIVQEVIIMPVIYNPLTSDFALIKLKNRPSFTPGYMRAQYKNVNKTLSTSKQYYLGTLTGIINISPTDPDSVLSSLIIDTTSENDNVSFDDRVGAPLLFCDQERDQYIQAGIFSSFNATNSHQRNTNLLMLTEHIYNYIADRSFSKCYEKRRKINDGEERFHSRAKLGDSIVHIYATTYSSDRKPKQRRCSGSFYDEKHIFTSATCLRKYVAEREKYPVNPELYETYDNMTYKMVLKIGFKDEIWHPSAIINEKNIKLVKLNQYYNAESGVADTGFVQLTASIKTFLDKNDRIKLTPVIRHAKIQDFDGEILMFVGIDRKGNSTRKDSIGSALYRVDQKLCENQKKADLCLTSQFIAPWRVPQNINIGGTFYVCDVDNHFKQIALLTSQKEYVSKALWLPNYLLV